ncbi:hypothetical protein ADL21_11340 [Streptomyces albus subsp. albus]|nr:hypothetical protein ADL21_11340 [Streptomyces albus subsp. albus]
MPELNARRAALLDTIRRQTGEWTTGRVQRLYRTRGIAPLRATARDDLHFLARAGFLMLHESPGRRFFTYSGSGAT